MEELSLPGNSIVDINPLLNMVNIEKIKLGDNQIIDIETLVNNAGIDNGDEVRLENNPLNDTSKNTYIPQLEARGVNVYQ